MSKFSPKLPTGTKDLIEKLDSLPFEEARELVHHHYFGLPGSMGDLQCRSWLATREAERRDREQNRSTRRANLAIAVSLISAAIALCALAADLIWR